jgi:RNA recognition motif-containing protein
MPEPIEPLGETESHTIILSNLPNKLLTNESLSTFVVSTFGAIADCEFSVSRRSASIRFFDLRYARLMRMCCIRYDRSFLEMAFGPSLPVSNAKKPPNNGTIALFHVHEAATCSMLAELFCQFGEIREIRETLHKRSQRFVEYWDTRAAEKARKEMNGLWLFGARMSVEYSLPGGWRRDSETCIEKVPTIERKRGGALRISGLTR